jgi:peroxin-6
VGQTDAHTEQNVKSLFKEAVDYIPAMLLLKHIQAFQPDQASSSQGNSGMNNDTCQDLHKLTFPLEPAVANTLKECIQSLAAVNKENNNQLLVIGTTDSLNDISRTVRNCFRHEIKLEVR